MRFYTYKNLKMMKNKQTAVDWLVQQTPNMHWEDGYWAYLFEQAIEMEKQQIIDAYYEGKEYGFKEHGEEYYNETFKQDGNK